MEVRGRPRAGSELECRGPDGGEFRASVCYLVCWCYDRVSSMAQGSGRGMPALDGLSRLKGGAEGIGCSGARTRRSGRAGRRRRRVRRCGGRRRTWRRPGPWAPEETRRRRNSARTHPASSRRRGRTGRRSCRRRAHRPPAISGRSRARETRADTPAQAAQGRRRRRRCRRAVGCSEDGGDSGEIIQVCTAVH